MKIFTDPHYKSILNKIIFVIFAIILFRIGSHIPVPGTDPIALQAMFEKLQGTVVGMMNTLSGGSLSRLSLFAIGIMPYISASIIMQLAGFFVESIKQLKEEGSKGQATISKYTKYLTIVLATAQSIGLLSVMATQTGGGLPVVKNPDFNFYMIGVLTLVTGTMFLVWIGEQITKYGIGNGISVIIYASVVSALPTAIIEINNLINNGELHKLFLVIIGILSFLLITFVVFVENGLRKIPVIYSNMNKNTIHDEKGTLPFKVNMAGIIPPIFAATLVMVPSTIITWFSLKGGSENETVNIIMNLFSPGNWMYILLYASLIIFFNFFYVSLIYNPKDTAKKLQEQGAVVPGFRPGEETLKYIAKLTNKITLIGAIYMTFICLIPEFLIMFWNVPFYFGGTSLLIIVIVGLDIYNQYKNNLESKEYDEISKDMLNDIGMKKLDKMKLKGLIKR